jgi:hypothetical protein
MLSIQRKSGEPESRAHISLSIPSIPLVVQIKGEAKEGYPGERLLSEWLTNDQDIKGAFSYASNNTVFVLELQRLGGASEISCDIAYRRPKIRRLGWRLIGW